jgi:hypothetical protein
MPGKEPAECLPPALSCHRDALFPFVDAAVHCSPKILTTKIRADDEAVTPPGSAPIVNAGKGGRWERRQSGRYGRCSPALNTSGLTGSPSEFAKRKADISTDCRPLCLLYDDRIEIFPALSPRRKSINRETHRISSSGSRYPLEPCREIPNRTTRCTLGLPVAARVFQLEETPGFAPRMRPPTT